MNTNGVQFKLNAAQFLLLPPSERKDVIVERTAAVGADNRRSCPLCMCRHRNKRSKPNG